MQNERTQLKRKSVVNIDNTLKKVGIVYDGTTQI